MSTKNLQIDTFRSEFALELAKERFALRAAAHLSGATDALPHDITERLRVSRQQAVAKRKLASLTTASSYSNSGGAATMTLGGERFGLWTAFGSALPLIALVVGLVVITNIQNDDRAREVAEVDAALLTDDLPPSAYTDPGFLQFIKSRNDLSQ
jgi:Protein of unknown function (DUF3619)